MKKTPHSQEKVEGSRHRQISTWRQLAGLIFKRYRYHPKADATKIEEQARVVQENRSSKIGFSNRAKTIGYENQHPFALPKVEEGFLPLDEAISPDTIRAEVISSVASHNTEVDPSLRGRINDVMRQNPDRPSKVEEMLQNTQKGLVPSELSKMTPQGDTAPGRAIVIAEEEGK